MNPRMHHLKLVAVMLLTALAATVAAQQTALPKLNDGQLHVLMCGTGSPIVDANRASACVAVAAGDELILVDSGPGSWRQVALSRFPVQKLSAILLTHFHSDHIGDLGEAITQSWIGGRTKTLDVYGPKGVEAVVSGFKQAYSFDVAYRVAHHTVEIMPRAASGAIPHTVTMRASAEATTVFERNGLTVVAFQVDHTPVRPAYGYRINYRGRSVVISGDTIKSANLARHAAGADLLIHEVLAKDLMTFASNNFERSGDKRRAKLTRDILTYHTSPAEAAEVAAAAKVDTLILTHLVPPIAPPVTEEMFLRGVAEAFKGKVVIAKDGMRFDLQAR